MEEIIEIIRSRMALVDPGLDVTNGSIFDQQVLQYVRDQFGVGDLELDLIDMLVRRINQLDPQISTADGSAVHEFLIKPLTAIMQVPILEVQRIKFNQDLNNAPEMSENEVDRRVGNFFVERQTGDVAIGTVRAFFANPVPVNTNLTQRALTTAGLAFIPDGAFTAGQALVASQRENGLFYVDIPYVAETPGDQYSIGPGEVTTIENMPGLVRATNTEAFVGGVPRETNEAIVARTKKSLAERSLSSRNSIITILTERFPSKLTSVVPVGFGDPEMLRDALVFNPAVTREGIVLLYGQLGFPAGVVFDLGYDDVDPTTIQVVDNAGVLYTLALTSFSFSKGTGTNGTDRIVFAPALATTPVTILFYRYQGYLDLIETVPGSVEVPPLFPAPEQAQTIHVGGKVDIYVKPTTVETDKILVRNLDRFTVFKCADGEISFDVVDQRWYFTTARGLTVGEIGALRGDILEVVTADANGDPIALPGNTFVVDFVDVDNRRLRLSGVSVGFVPVDNKDVRIRMQEDRAFPLERLVAQDNFGSPVFLDVDGGSFSEFDSAVNLPLAPSFGFLNRDTADPSFPETFQTGLPMVSTRPSTLFAIRQAMYRFADGVASLGDVDYFVEEENIASASFNRPWRRVTGVTLLNALSLEPIEDQKILNIYPADIRSLDLSGGVDEVNEAAGKVRVYFEKPLTVLMYGGSFGNDVTRFVHRVVREVDPGVLVTFNLKYKLATHGPAGQPAVLARAEDFKYENGLYYIDVFVGGDHVASERSDSADVAESDLNLGDNAEMFVGNIDLADELYHRIDDLEFESAGDPAPKQIGTTLTGTETPVSSLFPYQAYLGTWAGGPDPDLDEFTISPNPDLIVNKVLIGDFVKVLKLAPTPLFTGAAPTTIPADLKLRETLLLPTFVTLGVVVGSVVVVSAPAGAVGLYFVTAIESSAPNANDTLVVTPAPGNTNTIVVANGPTLAYTVYNWVAGSTHTVVDVLDSNTVVLNNKSTGVNKFFVILSQNGAFRLKNPHIRLSDEYLEDGAVGNESNRAFRAEGYYFDTRNPYERTLADSVYTFSKQELSLFRYTEGGDTRYLPNEAPTGDDLVLPKGTDEIDGRTRDDFTFFCGNRTPISGTGFALEIGPATRTTGLFAPGALTAKGFPATVFWVDPRHLRVKAARTLRLTLTGVVGAYIPGEGVTGAPSTAVGAVVSSEAIVAGSIVLTVNGLTSTTASFTVADVVTGGTFGATGAIASIEYVYDTELKQIPYDPATAGTLTDNNIYMFQSPGSPAVDIVHVSAVNKRLSLSYEFLALLEKVVLVNGANSIVLADVLGVLTLTVTMGFTLGVTAAELADYVNDNVGQYYAIVAEDDSEGDVLVGTYLRGSSLNELGENFVSRQFRGKDIQIEYEWSRSALEVHNYVTARTTRSINQDLLVRIGIPILANVDIEVKSQFATESELEADMNNYILLLNEQSLFSSALVRLPSISSHIPIPVFINGFTILENRRFKTYRSPDGISPRRIEAIFPGVINVTVDSSTS